MEPDELWPSLLVPARARLNLWNQETLDSYGVPMTGAAKAQTLRSNALGEFRRLEDTRYELDEQYTESGKIHITDLATKISYQLKSVAALAFEQLPTSATLFGDDSVYGSADVHVVLYEFSTKDLLKLECGAARFVRSRGKRTKICLLHEPKAWGIFDIADTATVKAKAFNPGEIELFNFFGDRDDLTESDDH